MNIELDEIKNSISNLGLNRYHLGCGTVILKGWLNIGHWQHLDAGGLYKNPTGIEDTILLNHDLTAGIPANDSTLDAVYHAHMLEHLSYLDGISFLSEIYRVLKPNAIHRIVVPDLHAFALAYLQKNSILLQKYKDEALTANKEIYHTNGSIFMGMLHNHGHKMGWDYETLEFCLQRAGFVDIKQTLYQESIMSDITQIEPYSPVRALESLCVECRK
jgi:predicted SAM-dependent methyltransferase